MNRKSRVIRNQRIATRNKIIYHIVAILISIIMLYPLLWMLSSSLKANDEIFTTATSLIPTTFDALHNYKTGWAGIMGVGFGTFVYNSFIVAVIGTVGGMLSSILAAYAFARIEFWASKFWFVCLMITLIIPAQVMIVPQYIIFKKFNIIDTKLALIAPWVFGGAFFIFLFIQFFRGIPIELDESAEIDGCSRLQTLFFVLVPNMKSVVVTGGIFSFYWIWQDFFQPLVFMNDIKNYTVSLGLRLFLDPESASEYGAMIAMSVVSILPVLIIFAIFQKYLVEGAVTSGLKG